MLKVYKSRTILPFAFKWRDGREKKTYLYGRPLLDYERTTFPILDPENLSEVLYPLEHIRN